MNYAQNRRCTSSICEQSLCKVLIKMNENFWSYRLQKLGTLKVLRMDGQTERRTLLQMDSCWLPIKRKYPRIPEKFNGINFILSL